MNDENELCPRRKTVLVVEDNAMIRTLLREGLVRHQCEVVVAADADEALAIGRARLIDCVLTDLRLDGKTGLELCQELKRLGEQLGRRIPVWILSGACPGDLPEQVRQGDVAGFIRKPFNPLEIWGKIAPTLETVS